jgi:transcriptional repressor AefR-like protein
MIQQTLRSASPPRACSAVPPPFYFADIVGEATARAEVSHPIVIAMFRLAIGEATRSPEIAQALEVAGRNPSRDALTDLFASAQSARVIGAGDPSEMATQYLGLLWGGLMVSLLLGVASTPKEGEIKRRASKATARFCSFMRAPANVEGYFDEDCDPAHRFNLRAR